MARVKPTKAATATTNGVDPKIEKVGSELRKLGATSAIVSHTLGIPYSQAVALTAAYDKRAGHTPQKIVRAADGIKLDGYTVKDGRQAPAQARKKVAGKAKATKKA
jgi:hypothetical protein